ncbi:MAG: class I SAM-dependent methyltransferase [Candidatus Nanohaloarchaeota archaeon QJJ-7]|nr:class I SAM-dependent methyltransferase [Candidatus Nanohaloarchaeota archaeon QJJ-7]
MYKRLNKGKENVADTLETGIWSDTTTKPNRYNHYVEGVIQLADEGYLEPDQELKVLDIGSSTGEATQGFEKAVEYNTDLEVETVSYDVNRSALENNRADQRSDGYVQGMTPDVKSDDQVFLPFADESFDIVLSKTLLSRLSGDHQTRALQEINRVLDDEGVAAVEIDPEGKPRTYSGKERIVKAHSFDRAAQKSNDFSTYPIELESWDEELDPGTGGEPELETSDSVEQLGNHCDDAEIITDTMDASEQHESSYDGAVIL